MEYTKNQLAIHKIVNSSYVRPELTGIYLNSNKATATDSHRLIEIENKDMRDSSDIKPFIVDAKYLAKNWKQPAKQDYSLIVKNEQDSFATIESGSLSMKLPIIDSDYPDYKNIIPNTAPVASIKCNAAYLKEICDILEHVDSSLHTVVIEFRKSDIPLVITAESNKEKAVALLMPLRS